MRSRVIVIGAGIGGLSAAIRLSQSGFDVTVLEARSSAGGLASSLEVDGLRFDSGPYILLDRPGHDWAFHCMGLDLSSSVKLLPIRNVYEVLTSSGQRVCFHASLEETANGFEKSWHGSGSQYVRFVHDMQKTYNRLTPMLHASRPNLRMLIASGGLLCIPFLLQSLQSILRRSQLPPTIQNAIGIWTHVAGQSLDRAPSPLAFVPALIHCVGAFYPEGGVATIGEKLFRSAQESVDFRFNKKVKSIRCRNGRVTDVVTDDGDVIETKAVVSNASGLRTYLELISETPPSMRQKLEMMPLQSPGGCAYLAVRPRHDSWYLRFLLPPPDQLCRLLIMPYAMEQSEKNGWSPARLLSPMRHAEAERLGSVGQHEYLEKLIAEHWWKEHVDEFRVVAQRIPANWGAEFQLYRDSMNPAMTAHLMRSGRLAHRSPFVRGLYLAGSATHPGQWVSFCAISGILAADCLIEDSR